MAKESKSTKVPQMTAGAGGALGRIQKVEAYGSAPMPKSGVPIKAPKK